MAWPLFLVCAAGALAGTTPILVVAWLAWRYAKHTLTTVAVDFLTPSEARARVQVAQAQKRNA